MLIRRLVTLAALALIAAPLAAQTPSTTPAPAAAGPVTKDAPSYPAARPEDVASVDAIIAALYDVISGPAGQKRDWNRFYSLFRPGARLIPTGRRPDGTYGMRVLTPEDYATTAGPRLEEGGFFERELARRTERFGNVVHAFSTYDSKRTAADAQPFARGINSIQLWNDGTRWYVVTIFWEGERPDSPIPQQYLPR